jgi:flavin reductase (DIM6/NTAB) family NADH-FMN oxidoreductase RutF
MENHHFSWVNPLFLWPFSIAFCFETPRRHLRAAAHELWSESHDQQCLALAALRSESFTIKNGGFHQQKWWISPAKFTSKNGDFTSKNEDFTSKNVDLT